MIHNLSGTVVTNLCFADDIAPLAECEYHVQCLLNNIDEVSSRFGLKISKTEVECIASDSQRLNAHLGGNEPRQTDDFVYLGGTISSDVPSGRDIDMRVGSAAGTSIATYGWRRTLVKV